MEKHILMAFNGAKPGEEEEFDRWYDSVHIPEILSVPAFVSARRFRIVNTSIEKSEAWTNVSLYELETDDLPAALAALHATISPTSPAVNKAVSVNLIGSEIRAFVA